MCIRDSLDTTLSDLPRDVPLQTRQNLHNQHEGCPAHTARTVQHHLNVSHPGWWIGTWGPIPWPSRSPDLTQLEYYLWGYLKNRVYGVYTTPIASVNYHLSRITHACPIFDSENITLAT